MFAVWKLNEERIVLIFFAKEDLCNWRTIILVTNSTDARLSTQTATDVAASSTHDSIARSVTSRPVARLSAKLGTRVMTTFPRARLATRHAQFATRVLTLAMYATVFAFSGAWWARCDARGSTLVRTNQ